MRLNDVRKIIFSLAGIIFLTISLLAQTKEEQKKLWGDLIRQYNNPDEKIFDRWAVVEGVPLVKAVEGIPPEYAAAASILMYYDTGVFGKLQIYSGIDERFFPNAKKIIKNIGGNEKEQIFGKAYYERLDKFSKELKDISDHIDPENFVPQGIILSHLLYKKSHNINDAVTDFLNERFYNNGIMNVKGDFEVLSVLIGNRIPLIVMDSNSMLLCIGYLRLKGKKYIVAVNNNYIDYGLRSHGDSLVGKSNFSKRLRKKMKQLDKQFGAVKTDYSFYLTVGKLRQGIEVKEYTGGKLFIINIPSLSKILIKKFYEQLKINKQ